MVTWQFLFQSHLMHALTLGTKQTERIHLLPRKGYQGYPLDISMEKFIPAACVYREDHVCLIQPLKNSKSTDPDFPNISFFFSPRNCLDIQTDEECLCAGSCRKGIQKERSLPRNGAGDEFEQRNRSKEVMIIRNTGAKSIPTGIRALMFWEWYEFTGGIISTLAHLHLSAKDVI